MKNNIPKTTNAPDTSGTTEPAPITTQAPKPQSDGSFDVDLTELSSTVVYSEVYNMMVTPEDYVGKSVRMQGQFAVYEGEQRNYYACIIADATACCSQGIEFILPDSYKYPEDYPEIGDVITVSGIFDTYTEGEYQYCQLIDAKME